LHATIQVAEVSAHRSTQAYTTRPVGAGEHSSAMAAWWVMVEMPTLLDCHGSY